MNISVVAWHGMKPKPKDKSGYRNKTYTDSFEKKSQHISPSKGAAAEVNMVLSNPSLLPIPYSMEDRRELDQSLLSWFERKGVIREYMGGICPPPSIIALEAVIRDGTLLCSLLSTV